MKVQQQRQINSNNLLKKQKHDKGQYIKVNKEEIYFYGQQDEIIKEYLELQNEKDMMIRCFLKKRCKDRNYKEILQNDEQIFYVNESQFMILPNKSQKIFFSFNPKQEGIYCTEIEIYIFEQYVFVMLIVIAIKKSKLISTEIIINELNLFSFKNFIQEIITDILIDVKTQPLPNPDTTQSNIRKELFHKNNQNKDLNYNEIIYENFNNLRIQLCELLNKDTNQYWDMNVQFIQDMIKQLQNKNEQQKYRLQFEKIKDQSINSHKSNHYAQNEIKNILMDYVDQIPNIINDEKQKNEMPEDLFLSPNLQQTQLQQILGEIKILKKYKTEDEKIEHIKNFCLNTQTKLNTYLIEKLIQIKQDRYLLKIDQQIENNQYIFYSDYIDKISRKLVLDSTKLQNKKSLLLYTFQIKYNLDQNKNAQDEQQIDINNLDKLQLEEFIEILYFIESQPLKYTQVYLQLQYENGIYSLYSTQFIYEYLKNETELNIQWEQFNVIQNYKEKLQNDQFEDSCIVLCDNPQQQKNLKTKYLDHFNIQRQNQFLENYYEMKKLQTQTNLLIDCDKHNLFITQRISSVFNNQMRLFGPNIQKCLEFIRKYNSQIQQQDTHDKNVNVLILGGELNLKKINFLLFSQNFYDKIILCGIIGLKFFLYDICDNKNNLLNHKEIQCIEYFYKYIEQKQKIFIPNSFQYIELDNENQQLIKQIGEFNTINVQGYELKQQLIDQSKTFKTNEDLNGSIQSINDQLEITVKVNEELQQNEQQDEQQDEQIESNQTQNIKEEIEQDIKQQDENEQCDQPQETVQQTQIKQYKILNQSKEFEQQIFQEFKEEKCILIIDNLCLYKNTMIDILLENLLQHLENNFKIFENIQDNLLKKQVNICGNELIQNINNFQFQKVQKIKQIIEKKKQKKLIEQNGDKLEENDYSDQSQAQSDYDNLESEESEDDSDDENEELNLNINKLSNNIYKDSKFMLNILSNKYSSKLDEYDELDKVIIDPDDIDFSFLDELDQIILQIYFDIFFQMYSTFKQYIIYQI